MRRANRRWIQLLGLTGVAVIIAWVLRPPRIPVDTAAVERGFLRETIREDGVTRVRDRFGLAAPAAGQLHRLNLRVGDSVSAGAVIARLSPIPLDPRTRAEAEARHRAARDAQGVAEALVVSAQAALQDAVRAHQRAESLAVNGLISQQEREQAELREITAARTLESATFQAKAAAHDVEVASAALQPAAPLVLRSPVSGLVLAVIEESERSVLPGTPIVEIGDRARLEIVTDLLSTDAVQVAVGDTMLVEGWGGDDTLRAVVARVEPSGFTKVSALGVEEQRVNVIGRLVTRSVRLGDRYRVEVRIVLWQSDSVLIAPMSSFYRRGESWYTYVIRGGRARETAVTLGHRGEFIVEVLEGLTEGTLLVDFPDDRIADGVRVMVRPT